MKKTSDSINQAVTTQQIRELNDWFDTHLQRIAAYDSPTERYMHWHNVKEALATRKLIDLDNNVDWRKTEESQLTDKNASRNLVALFSTATVGVILGVILHMPFLALGALACTPFGCLALDAENKRHVQANQKKIVVNPQLPEKFASISAEIEQRLSTLEETHGQEILSHRESIIARYRDTTARLNDLFNKETEKAEKREQRAKSEDLEKIRDGIEAPLTTPRQRLTLRPKSIDKNAKF